MADAYPSLLKPDNREDRCTGPLSRVRRALLGSGSAECRGELTLDPESARLYPVTHCGTV
jgi:hypothetical protein